MAGKLVKTLREAIELSGLKSGMSVSFHHHLRNGDHVRGKVGGQQLAARSCDADGQLARAAAQLGDLFARLNL